MERPSKQSLLKRAVAALSSSTSGIQQANVLPSSPEVHSAASIERSVSCPPVNAAVARIAVSLPESEASKLDQVSDNWRQSLRWSLDSSQGTQSQSSLSLSQPPCSASTAPSSVQYQQRTSAPVRPSLAIPSFSFLQSQGWDDSQDSEDNEMYLHLREVVEARRDCDEVKSTAAYKTISTRLRAVSMLSLERAEILGESGCAFFWRAKRATAAGYYEEGHSLAKQAIVYLNTALKIQETQSAINSYFYLRLGQCNELLGPDRYENALQAYAQGVNTAASDGAISKKFYMAKVRLLEVMGETARAWEALQVMTTIWAGDDTLQIRLAKVLLAFKPPTIANVRSALCCVDEAILLDPDNPEYAKVGESLQRLLEDMSRPVNHVLGGRAPIRQQTPSDMDYGEITPPGKTMFEGTNSGPSFWQVLRSKSPSLRPRSRASTVSSHRQRLHQTSPEVSVPIPEHLPAPSFRPRTTSPLAGRSGPTSADRLNARPRSADGQLGCDQQFLALQENVSQHTQVLTDQVARMNHTENSIDGIMTRLAALETGQSAQTQPFASTSSQEARPMLGRRATRTSAPSLTRPTSVPPNTHPFQLENLSQEELLERSVMLYGVWAMEKMLAKSPAPE